MKILLATPVREKQYYIVPSLGLGYLATALRCHRHEVSILDCVREQFDLKKFRFFLRRNKPDVLGFQVFPQDVDSIISSLTIAKEEVSGLKAVLGGPFISGIPSEVFNFFKDADYAFCGEAELGLPLLIDYLKLEDADKEKSYMLYNIPGLIYRNNGRVIANNPRFADDLDSLGFPAWDLIKPHEYPPAPHSVLYKRCPIAPILVSRGCPYSCTFCAASTISGKKIRVRSIKNVMDEIELLYNKFKIREFQILDDCFISKQELVEKFCESLLQKGLKIAWCAANGVRLDKLNETILRLMKKSGLYAVRVGIESGSPRILRQMKKGLSIEVIEERIALLNKLKINTHGYFILGYPGETKKELDKTIKFALKLKIQTAGFSLFLPLPGSQIYKQLKTENKLQGLDFNKMMTHNVVFSPKGILPEELKKIQKKAFLKFYLRPKVMFNFLCSINNISHFKYILRRAFKIMFTGK